MSVVTVRFATTRLNQSKTDGEGLSVYTARTNAGRMRRSFAERPRRRFLLAKTRRGRFSSHDWKAKKNDYKKRTREIKQLHEIGECTVVFATLNTIDRDGDVLMPSAIGEQVVPGHGGT